MSVAAAAAAATTATTAAAAPWGYEQVTPADDGVYGPYAIGASDDFSTALVTSYAMPMTGQPGDGRPGPYLYAMRRGGGDGWTPFQYGPVSPVFGPYLVFNGLRDVSDDGTRGTFITTLDLSDGEGGGGTYLTDVADPNAIVSVTDGIDSRLGSDVLTPDGRVTAFAGWFDGNLYRSRGTGLDQMNLDGDGNPMNVGGMGGMIDDAGETLTANALSADGTAVIFGSTTALEGDTDTAVDLYRRVDGPGGTETILLTDGTPGPDPDAELAAEYRWASRDHGVVLFRTAEAHPGDGDDAADLYLRRTDGSFVRVSQGQVGGDAPAPVGDAEWVASSEDGNRVFFVTREQLTGDAPSDTGEPKLYERDVAAGVTRFVAGPLAPADVNPGSSAFDSAAGSLTTIWAASTTFRGIRVTPQGAVFQSAAPLAGDADGEVDVFAWTRGGDLRLLSAPAAGAPASPSADATIVVHQFQDILAPQMPVHGGRAVSSDGARAFLSTRESLTAEDTDGGREDVYAVSVADGSVQLVTPPGDEQQDALYVGSSPDGTRAFFQTRATVLASDIDNGDVDTYLAVLGGGAAPSTPVASTPGGPGAPAGPMPVPPPTSGPASSQPKPPERPAPPASTPGGEQPGRAPATLSVEAEDRLGRGRTVTLRVEPSVAGRLRVVAKARLGRKGRTRVGRETLRVAGEPIDVRVALSRRAARRLERRGRLEVRFVVRLRPAGDARPVTDRTTVDLRPGRRR